MIGDILKSIKHVVYSVLVGGLIVVPAVVGYVAKIEIVHTSSFTIGLYGVSLITYLAAQMVFAEMNRRQIESCNGGDTILPEVVISAVGYREDPVLFKECLESLKIAETQVRCRRVLIVIDGNDADDHSMQHVFRQVFDDENSLCLSTDILPSASPEPRFVSGTHELDSAVLNTDKKYVCIFQPHRGKRHALYSAARWAILEPGVGAVFFTDSDTEVSPDAVKHLLESLQSDPRNAAVTGQCLISNKYESWISFMAGLRYWFASNLERAAQSFFGCVVCISGPIGLYRTSVLKQVLRPWISQTFFGGECTYGDDRHLTNRVLLLGHKTRFTHKALCSTETPATLNRWMRQQIRWNKSFVRELWWSMRAFPMQSFWFGAEITYQATYKVLVAYSLIVGMFISPVSVHFGLFLSATFVVGVLRGIYGAKSRMINLLNPMYSLLYILFLLPANFYAYLTMWDTSWGTSVRDKRLVKSEWIDLAHTAAQFVFVAAWDSVLVAGTVLRILKLVENQSPFVSLEVLSIVIPTGLWVSVFCFAVSILLIGQAQSKKIQQTVGDRAGVDDSNGTSLHVIV